MLPVITHLGFRMNDAIIWIARAAKERLNEETQPCRRFDDGACFNVVERAGSKH